MVRLALSLGAAVAVLAVHGSLAQPLPKGNITVGGPGGGFWGGPIISGIPGTPVPPACSNTLDFSDACNSQYLGVVI